MHGHGMNVIKRETEGDLSEPVCGHGRGKMKRGASSHWREGAMVRFLGSCSHPHLHRHSLPLPSLLHLVSSSPHNNVRRRLRGSAAAATASLVHDELVRSNPLKRRSLLLACASAFAFSQLKAAASEEAVPGA